MSPKPGRWQVDFGAAELLGDLDGEDAWLLRVDGVAQSHVDLGDPRWLEFDYIRTMADVVDLQAQEGEPVTVLHLGGGLCTLARYTADTRPGSRQLVLEADTRLAEMVRAQLGTAGFRLKVADAVAEVPRLSSGGSDVVVVDCYAGPTVPTAVTTREFVAEVARLLAPGGTAVANISDGRPLDFTRGQVATWLDVFAHVALLADPQVLKMRRFGNLVVVGSDAPLPLADLAQRGRREPGRARVVAERELAAWTGGAAVVTTGTAVDPPRLPGSLFDR